MCIAMKAYNAGRNTESHIQAKLHIAYFHVCDKSGLSCGLLMNMLPYLPTVAITVNASKVGSIMCLLKQTNALPSSRP